MICQPVHDIIYLEGVDPILMCLTCVGKSMKSDLGMVKPCPNHAPLNVVVCHLFNLSLHEKTRFCTMVMS